MYPLDKIDKKIISMLQKNSRITIKEMATVLHLTTTPIFERIKKLEKANVIVKYVALVSPAALDKKLFAYVNISLKEHAKEAVEDFVNQVINFDEVIECHHITGAADFVLKVLVNDIEAYNLFVLDRLSVVKNIDKVESSFCLSVRKYTTEIPLDH